MPARDGTGPSRGGGGGRVGGGGGNNSRRDRNRGGRAGPPEYCRCPGCGNQVPKRLGQPCREILCTQCGSTMVGS
ncbi:MAG: hypothetical protein ABRQ24_10855 [Syntrophomonadaceae bacterium]